MCKWNEPPTTRCWIVMLSVFVLLFAAQMSWL
jgi:hypothetical protein